MASQYVLTSPSFTTFHFALKVPGWHSGLVRFCFGRVWQFCILNRSGFHSYIFVTLSVVLISLVELVYLHVFILLDFVILSVQAFVDFHPVAQLASTPVLPRKLSTVSSGGVTDSVDGWISFKSFMIGVSVACCVNC